MTQRRQDYIETIRHRFIDLDGIRVFLREAGQSTAPAVLLPHGYPCSSYEFRNFMSLLADRWHLIAPDFPGCGYSDTPENFAYDFDGYADFLDRLIVRLNVERFALYLHDFGSQIGLRLAIKRPERIAALIIQNGDIYEDQLGPKYAPLQASFRNPTPEAKDKLAEAVSEEGFKDEFLNDVKPELAERIPPDLWKLHWSLMTPQRRQIAVDVITATEGELELVSAIPTLPTRSSTANADRLGTAGRLHARRRRPRLFARRARRGTSPARWGSLAAGNAPR